MITVIDALLSFCRCHVRNIHRTVLAVDLKAVKFTLSSSVSRFSKFVSISAVWLTRPATRSVEHRMSDVSNVETSNGGSTE